MTNVAIEVLDVKVEILVKLINANHVFMKEMFRGGATKLDVERMREKPRIHARKKTASVKGKAVTSLDEAKIISLCFKLEILSMVQNALSKHVLEKEAMTPPRVTTSKVPSGANITAGPVDANDEILKNVMANISDYSTPPDSVDRVQLSDGRTRSYRPQGIASPGMWNENNGGATYSATSQTNDRNKTEGIPSFDLGVTQDVRPPVAPCRKSKRLRLSSGLLEIPGGIGLLSERIKGVAQNNNAADSALTAALLMQTHALFGPNTCRCITPDVLGDEAHRAAVMLYEFHEKLQ
ncbi:BnaA03g60730D [Brassica napus]|uniref:BnaA03g60730D protein n=1 Tax=Brassica napus TaxID=3708 RepID=A0A078ID90_BRANA|nr:BnaA03g60730D [Brassica napus]